MYLLPPFNAPLQSYELNARKLETRNHYGNTEVESNVKDVSDGAMVKYLEDDDDDNDYKVLYSW